MPITGENRTKLNSVIGQMKANNESEDSIKEMVGQFKAKYDTPTEEPGMFKKVTSAVGEGVKIIGRQAKEAVVAVKEEPGAAMRGFGEGLLTPFGEAPQKKEELGAFQGIQPSQLEEMSRGLTPPSKLPALEKKFEGIRGEEKKFSEQEAATEKLKAPGRFVSKMGMGIAASTLVPGSGFLPTIGKGAVANIPFVPPVFKEGGTKEALKDVALNTAFDALLFGAGKAIPLIKSAILKKAPGLADDAVEQLAKESFEQAQKAPKLKKLPLGARAETISGAAPDISKVKGTPGVPFSKDIPEAEARLLKQKKAPKSISFEKYAEQATAKSKNLGVKSTFQVAGENATKAFRAVDDLRKGAGEKITNLVSKNSKVKINIKDDIVDFMDRIKSDIGGVFDETGKLVDAPGSLINDAAAVKDANAIFKKLKSIPVEDVTAQQAINLRRYMQNLVKFTSEGQFKMSGSSMDRLVKGLSANINNKLNTAIPGLEKANAEFVKIKKLTDSMSKVLGKPINAETGLSKHGASVMKRGLESLADSGISDMFRQVKELTGGQFDLFQDATYASIAARLSGDTRQIGQALPFGGLGSKVTGGGTMATRGLDAIAKLAKKKYKGKELKRVLEFYKKSQGVGKRPTPDLSVMGSKRF